MQTVLFVRHADVDLPTTADSVLNDAGVRRAQELADVVSAAHVASVFTSTALRTKLTAAPLAARLGLQPEEVPPPDEFAHRVLAGELGAVIVVVGHSNTVPEMIAALGADSPPTIGEREFDNLFAVTVAADREVSVLVLKYGN